MVYAMHLMLEPFLHNLIVQLLHVKASHWKMKDIFWLGVTHHWGFQWKYSPFPWIVTNFFVTEPRRWKRKGWALPLQLSVRFFRLEALTNSLIVMMYFFVFGFIWLCLVGSIQRADMCNCPLSYCFGSQCILLAETQKTWLFLCILSHSLAYQKVQIQEITTVMVFLEYFIWLNHLKKKMRKYRKQNKII